MLTESTTNLEKVVPEAHDFLPLFGTDHVELIVGNAKQSAYYYMAAWGFQPLAFKGLETGSKARVSYVLRQDKITLVLTTPLKEGGALNAHLDKHGDGVKSVALWVPDARKSLPIVTFNGAADRCSAASLAVVGVQGVVGTLHAHPRPPLGDHDAARPRL